MMSICIPGVIRYAFYEIVFGKSLFIQREKRLCFEKVTRGMEEDCNE